MWAISANRIWATRVTPRIVAMHAGLASAYAVAWILGGHLVLLPFGYDALGYLREANLLGWRFWTGVLLYGLTAALSYAFRTRRRLMDQELRAHRAEVTAAESRLRAIRSQMNPHFLFNALHSLGSLVEHDPAGAQEAIERLGELLRYSLDDEDGEVLLAEEWNFTRNYLEMERIRLGDRLIVETRIDDDMLSIPVPSFSLQTLVENAIRHGVSAVRVGKLLVDISGQDRDLVIRVTDDGPGASSGQVAQSPGRGLRLMKERLTALYGHRATLETHSEPGPGFTAELRIAGAAALAVPVSVLESAG